MCEAAKQFLKIPIGFLSSSVSLFHSVSFSKKRSFLLVPPDCPQIHSNQGFRVLGFWECTATPSFVQLLNEFNTRHYIYEGCSVLTLIQRILFQNVLGVMYLELKPSIAINTRLSMNLDS